MKRFRMGRRLGKGGFGEVYAAVQIEESGETQPVAVKVLNPEVPTRADAWRRLLDESRLLRGLDHPNILAFHGLTRLADRTALVTELVDGADLATCMRQGTVPVRVLLQIVRAVALALHSAYTTPIPGSNTPLQLVHRDIKPANIIIARTGRVVLLDFGIARSDAMVRAARTKTDHMVGSEPYMAPELFRSSGPPHPGTDIFSLAATLYEGVVRQRLFVGMSTQVRASCSVVLEQWVPLMERRLAVGGRLRDYPQVRQLLAEMTAFDPSDRPSALDVTQQCATMIEALDDDDIADWAAQQGWSRSSDSGSLSGRELVEQPDPETEIHLSSFAPVAQEPPRHAWIWALGGLALLGLGIGSVLGPWLVALVGPESATIEPMASSSVVQVDNENASKPPDILEEPVATAPASRGASPAPERPQATSGSAAPQTQVVEVFSPNAKPAVEAPPPMPPPARVRVVGAAQVWVTPKGQAQPRTFLGASETELRPGRYSVLVRFDGEEAFPVLDLDLAARQEVTLRCDPRLQVCAAK